MIIKSKKTVNVEWELSPANSKGEWELSPTNSEKVGCELNPANGEKWNGN